MAEYPPGCAFQDDAFQTDAFQVCDDAEYPPGCAFQDDAFQTDAFQVCDDGVVRYVPDPDWVADEYLHQLPVREIAADVFAGKPPPVKQQDAVADAARALLAGGYANEDEAARALEREAAQRAWQWGQQYRLLLQRYLEGLAQMEQERRAHLEALAIQQRKRNQQAIAVLMMLAH